MRHFVAQKNNKIGIIGTRATIASNAYAEIIAEKAGESVKVISQETPLFVPLVEEGMIKHEATKLIAQEYLTKFIDENIDTLVLGCTHYPLLSQMI
jgi:glutamate racemase